MVTVALAEEEQCRRALEKKVHMTALQVSSRPPHSSLRGMWSCEDSGSSSQPRDHRGRINDVMAFNVLALAHVSRTGLQRSAPPFEGQ